MDCKIRDVMTTTVVTVTDSASFKEIVGLIDTHRVSALPVVDRERHLLGIVSEADLLLQEEYDPDTDTEGRYLFELRRRKIERKKATGLVAAQLMTTPVVTVGPEATLREAAQLLHQRQVKRLPVIDQEARVIGIVSRADLLKVFLRPDQEILEEVIHRVLLRLLWLEPGTIKVQVRDGVVLLQGVIERRNMIPVLVALVQGVDGVVGVNPHLDYLVDDVSARPSLPQTWGMMPKPYRWP